MRLTDLIYVLSGYVIICEDKPCGGIPFTAISAIPWEATTFKNRYMEKLNIEFREVYMVRPYYDNNWKDVITVIIIEESEQLEDDKEWRADFDEAFDSIKRKVETKYFNSFKEFFEAVTKPVEIDIKERGWGKQQWKNSRSKKQ